MDVEWIGPQIRLILLFSVSEVEFTVDILKNLYIFRKQDDEKADCLQKEYLEVFINIVADSNLNQKKS